MPDKCDSVHRRPINSSYVTLLDRSRERQVQQQQSLNEQRERMREQMGADYYRYTTHSPEPSRGGGLVMLLLLLAVAGLLWWMWV